jgi:hypothetical protein
MLAFLRIGAAGSKGRAYGRMLGIATTAVQKFAFPLGKLPLAEPVRHNSKVVEVATETVTRFRLHKERLSTAEFPF